MSPTISNTIEKLVRLARRLVTVQPLRAPALVPVPVVSRAHPSMRRRVRRF